MTHEKLCLQLKMKDVHRYFLSSSYVRGLTSMLGISNVVLCTIDGWQNKVMKCKSKQPKQYIVIHSGFVRYKTPLLNMDSTYFNTIKPFFCIYVILCSLIFTFIQDIILLNLKTIQ